MQALRGRIAERPVTVSDAVQTGRRIYSGRVISLDLCSVTLPNGRRTELELVRHPGGAAVVALDRDQRICLLRQFRHVTGGWIWELPAGRLESTESPLETARRELREEAGTLAADWLSLGHTWSSPGVFGERIHLWLARDLAGAQRAPEPDEVMEVHWLEWDEAWAMAEDGRIGDGKTLAGLLRARPVVLQT